MQSLHGIFVVVYYARCVFFCMCGSNKDGCWTHPYFSLQHIHEEERLKMVHTCVTCVHPCCYEESSISIAIEESPYVSIGILISWQVDISTRIWTKRGCVPNWKTQLFCKNGNKKDNDEINNGNLSQCPQRCRWILSVDDGGLSHGRIKCIV